MRKLLAGLLAVLATAGCDSTPPPVASTVSVTPGSLTLDAVGATRVVRASVADQNGKAMSGVALSWNSSSAAATVLGAGGDSAVVTAAGNGAATISASAGTATGAVTVQVTQVAASLHKAGGDEQSGAAGGALAQPVRVEARDRLGNPVAGVAVNFSVSSGG
jgi:hypothetical protein